MSSPESWGCVRCHDTLSPAVTGAAHTRPVPGTGHFPEVRVCCQCYRLRAHTLSLLDGPQPGLSRQLGWRDPLAACTARCPSLCPGHTLEPGRAHLIRRGLQPHSAAPCPSSCAEPVSARLDTRGACSCGLSEFGGPSWVWGWPQTPDEREAVHVAPGGCGTCGAQCRGEYRELAQGVTTRSRTDPAASHDVASNERQPPPVPVENETF